MILYTAPRPFTLGVQGLPSVFLAGGITNCPNWQDEVIKGLEGTDCIILNPRRENFPIDDPNASEEQITWEFHALNQCDIFSMWFSDAPSDQPICMYELGRQVALRQYKADYLHEIAVGVEPGYKREKDVFIQLNLIHPELGEDISWSLDKHIYNIKRKIDSYLIRKACS